MSKYTSREKCANLCYACVHDCKSIEPIERCDNFIKGYTRHEYVQMLNEDNVDLKRLCTKNRISYNYMLKMLEGRIFLTYKYRMILNSRLGELEEYIPYIEKFDNKDVSNG